MQKNGFLKIVLLFLFFTKPCFAIDQGFIVANVNNHIITNSDLQDRYNFVIFTSKIKVNSSQEKSALMNQIIDKMIDEELIRQEAKNLNIAVEENEVDEIIQSLAAKQKTSVASLKLKYSTDGISFSKFKKQIETDLLWSKIVTDSLRTRIKITDSKIKEYLEQQKLSLDISKFLIAEIYIQNSKDAKVLVNKLADEINNGADFQAIVKQFSHSPTSDNYGEIGWVSKSEISPKIYEEVSKLKKSQITKPVFLNDGYYIFKLIDKKSVSHIEESDMQAARMHIFSRELEIESKRYLMELRRKSFIEVRL